MSLSFEELREKAFTIGYDDIGITPAQIAQEEIDSYLQWLEKEYHGSMSYMENRARIDPQAFFPGAKTAVLFVSYYKQEKIDPKEKPGLIASYARGKDYHHIHRKRLKNFIQWLEEKTGQKEIAKGFSDSSPLLEKALAVQAGLGWMGKNTLLIHRRFGTFILISGLLTTLSFTEERIELRLPRCGSCTRCLDSCPTQALISPYTLDATRCLSYHLIESKDPIPEEIQEKNPGYLFGCDVCQDVCPHNARTLLSSHAEFSSDQGLGTHLQSNDIEELENAPEKLHGTPLQRRGVKGLKYSNRLLSKPRGDETRRL